MFVLHQLQNRTSWADMTWLIIRPGPIGIDANQVGAKQRHLLSGQVNEFDQREVREQVQAAHQRVAHDARLALEAALAEGGALLVGQRVVGRVEEAAQRAQPHGQFLRRRESVGGCGMLGQFLHSSVARANRTGGF